MAEESLLPQVGNAFGTLVQQVLHAGAGLAGMAAIASSVNSVFSALGSAVSALMTPFRALLSMDFGKLLTAPTHVVAAFVSLTDAALKLTSGLFSLGAAAAPGGLEAFAQVMEYVTAVLGKVAIPVFVALSTAILTIVEHFSGPLNQAATGVAKWLGQYLVVAIDKAIDFIEIDLPKAINTTIEYLQGFGSALKKLWDWLVEAYAKVNLSGAIDERRNAAKRGDALEEYRQAMLAGDKEGMKRWGPAAGISHVGEKVEDIKFDTPTDRAKTRTTGKDAARNLDDLLATMQNAFAKKANVGYSGIADIHKTIQQQSFGGTIAARTLLEMQKNTKVAEETRDAVRKNNGATGGSAISP